MKTRHPCRTLRFAGLFALVWLCFAAPLHALSVNNPSPVGGYTPFVGQGEKRTGPLKDGYPTKFEWIKDGKMRLEVFVNTSAKTTTLTWIQKREDGTTQSQKEQVFSREDKALLSETKQDFDSTGRNVVAGTKQGFDRWDEGKRELWVKRTWDAKFGE